MMLTYVLKFLGPIAPYLAVGGAAAALLLYVSVLRHELAAAQVANATLRATNQADAAAIAADEKQQQMTNDALDTLDVKTRQTQAAADGVITQIAGAQAQDNGPVAPVLAKTLDSLRALQGSAP